MKTFDIILRRTLEIGGQFDADTEEEAIELAKVEMRAQGEYVGSAEVVRCIESGSDEELIIDRDDSYDSFPDGFVS